ncbi:MAG: tetratricopeptide repeat protein, partial [Candidatus Dadabacteria bacterium]
MAGRVAAAALVVFLAAGVSAAGVREQAGMARALLGAGPEALDLLGREPAAGSRADRYFRALALDRAGFRAAALGVWAELAATGGPFSGPALEAAVDREFARGRYERVAALAAAANPGRLADPDALWYRVGQSLRMLGRSPEAAEALGRVSQGPFLPYALHTLAQIRFEEDRHAEALDLLARAVEAAPEPLADRIRLTRGRILYQVAVGLSGLDPEARERGLQVARDQFGRIQPESPWYAQALEGMGWCDLELGATAEALAAFTLAAERDPD